MSFLQNWGRTSSHPLRVEIDFERIGEVRAAERDGGIKGTVKIVPVNGRYYADCETPADAFWAKSVGWP